MLTERELVEKLRKIQSLFDRPGTPGERQAAAEAMQRIQARLRELRGTEPLVEFKFTHRDQWSRMLFVSLARKHGIEAYRYKGQRRNTVMVEAAPSFIRGTLVPEFEALNDTLGSYLTSVTARIIREGVWGGDPEVSERRAPQPHGSAGR